MYLVFVCIYSIYSIKIHILKGEPPSYRDHHSATAVNNCMYIFGGRGNIGPEHSYVCIYEL